MKNAICFLTLTLLLSGFQVSLSAQKQATWKGGAPGRSADWNCAGNWAEGRVPSVFSDVLIPNVLAVSGVEPVIQGPVESVNSLMLLPGAQLHIEKLGALEVITSVETFGANPIKNKGVLIFPAGKLDLEKRDEATLATHKH